MAETPVPVSDWKGHYSCPSCGEEIRFHREVAIEQADDIPNDVFAQVHHDHEIEKPTWAISIFRRKPKGKWPVTTRSLRLLAENAKHQLKIGGR